MELAADSRPTFILDMPPLRAGGTEIPQLGLVQRATFAVFVFMISAP